MMKAFFILISLSILIFATDRESAVSGVFYPKDRESLSIYVDKLLQDQNSTKTDNLRAIIVPHAGYIYSGEVSASIYAKIDKTKVYKNIFLIGSSHYLSFDGASIYAIGDYLTPLGEIKVNTELATSLIKNSKVFTFKKEAHVKEHSLEVQLPFLQKVFNDEFHIIPIIIGSDDKNILKQIAKELKPYFNHENLFIISSDLSHYCDYEHASTIDKETISSILQNSSQKFINQIVANEDKKIKNLVTSACGSSAILSFLYMSEIDDDLQFSLIKYQNSGDVAQGDKERVVGYGGIIVEDKKKESFMLNHEEKKLLLELAKYSVELYVKENKVPSIDSSKLPQSLQIKAGVFVTLHKDAHLRGCIGTFSGDTPLYQAVINMAISASTRDPRFNPVNASELSSLDYEISVLTPMKKINSIDEIVLGKHGIYIVKNGRSGTFLPQVATDTGWNLEEFLGHCAQDKAGIGYEGWRDADIYTYEAIVFN